MKIRYNLHIHSGLSPCADKDMTPVNIVGVAAVSGMNMVAVSDHNAILNVEVALRAGEAYGVTVVPAVEVQTAEDIHILCLFAEFCALKAFFEQIPITQIKNKPDIFGDQLIYDEDDNVVGRLDNLLLTSSTLSAQSVCALAREYGGASVAAHIDREANSMLQIFGAVIPEVDAVELSTRATTEDYERWCDTRIVLRDSDAHTVNDIVTDSELELPQNTAAALVAYLRGEL